MSHQNFPSAAAAVTAALFVLTFPFSSLADSGSGSHSASAIVRIRVVVPPYVHILRNNHPAVLIAQGGSNVIAEQHMTVRTNQAHGFCLDLMAAEPSAPTRHWQVRSSAGDSIELNPQGNGYRLCGNRQGTYAFTLTHHFQFESSPQPTESAWPLLASIAQI